MGAMEIFRALFSSGSFDFSEMELCATFNIQNRNRLKLSASTFVTPVKLIAASGEAPVAEQIIGLVSEMASGKTTWSKEFLSNLLEIDDPEESMYGCRIDHPDLGLVSHYDAFSKQARVIDANSGGSMAGAARMYWEVYQQQIAQDQELERKGIRVVEHAALEKNEYSYVWSFEQAATAKLYTRPELSERREIKQYVDDMRGLSF